MLRFILFLLIATIIVRFFIRATRFLSSRGQRRQMEEQRRRHPEDYAKRAQVIEEDSPKKSDQPDS
jgi:hypothetical protein